MADDETPKDIWKALNMVKYSAKIGEDAGRADRMFYKHLQEGIENNDLDKIYEFIEASERGYGIRSDERVREIFRRAYEEDPERLCKTLAGKNNIVDYWIFLTTCCDTDMILSFTKINVPYAHFYYECARILMRRMQRGVQCEDGVVFAVRKFVDADLSLWERWLRKNEYNMQWQTLVFRVLENADLEALRGYAQTIHLDMTIQRRELDIITQAFNHMKVASKEYILSGISSVVWNRWCQIIEEKKKNFNFIKKICITGYTNIILNAFLDSLSGKEEWKLYFLRYGEVFIQDMCAWYEAEPQMISTFFYDITQIYYVLLVGKQCQMIEVDDEIRCYIQNIKIYIRRYRQYWEKGDEQRGEIERMLDGIEADCMLC